MLEENNFVQKRNGITGTTLKMIALIAMFIDHFAAILIENYLLYTTPFFTDDKQMQDWYSSHPGVAALNLIMLLMRLIGRFGFPLFAFLIVEGFLHTRSVKKYALNLGVFALLSEIPFNLGFSSRLFYPHYQNVFFTLLLGLLCIAGIHGLCENLRNSEKLRLLFYPAAMLAGPYIFYMLVKNSWFMPLFFQPDNRLFLLISVPVSVVSLVFFIILAAKWETARRNAFSFSIILLTVFCIVADLLMTDYSAGGVLTIAVMYFLRKNRKTAFAAGCLLLTLMSWFEISAFLMLIPVAKYNGKRGMKINKYVFYAFYPLHIGLIYLLTWLLGFTGFALGSVPFGLF